jgi:hypothetical protein
MIRGILVIILISYLFLGNGSNYGSIAYAGKVLFNQVTAALLQANINGVSITNALTDQIVSTKAKTSLSGKSRFVMRCPTLRCYCLNRYLAISP